ncbi:unnamed protein product [Phytomonas sp. Hart1]|nr:unnamed protein product [Phytomonas sp. Hart1]|eukprot:CCW68007.1 unnamed protein product [Phytomonas sp. isolate Hart1]
MLDYKDYVGGIPLIVHLSEQDILSLVHRPLPLVFVLPRTTLLIAILHDVLEFFAPYGAVLNQYTTQVWFSYESMVVPWGYPVGAVRDFVQELQATRRRGGSPDRVRFTDSTSLHALTHRKPDGDGGGDTAGARDRQPLGVSFSSEPLELEFRIYQPSGFKTIERCAPFLVNFDRLDDYIRNEIKQLHKMAYSAIYGSYKRYLNAPESVLQVAVSMALYRPFEASSGSDFCDTALAVPRTFSSVTSSYLLMEYHGMLKSVSQGRRLTYVVQLGFPWAYRGGKKGPILRFHYYPVNAAPLAARDPRWGGVLSSNSDEKGITPKSLDRASSHSPEPGRSGRQAPHDPDCLLHADDEALTLGLLLWRLFCAPCLRWRRLFSFPLSSPTGSTGASVSAEGEEENNDVFFRSMAVFYTDPPSSPTTNSEPPEMVCEPEPEPQTTPWGLWEAAMSRRFIETYEDNGGDPVGESFGAGAIYGIPIVPDKNGLPNQDSEPERMFFKIQGVVPSLRTPAKFLETYLTSSDRSLYVTVGTQ